MRMLVVLLLAVIVSQPSDAAKRRSLDELRDEYVEAPDTAARVGVIIAAADLGYIREGCDVKNIEKLFSTRAVTFDPSRRVRGYYSGIVSISSEGARAGRGKPRGLPWEFKFKYTDDGRIYSYYITNVSKMSDI